MTGVCLLIAAMAQSAALADSQGLQGFYYGNGIAPGSIANAQSYIAAHNPLATFTSTNVEYPNNGIAIPDGNTLATFLGVDATSLSNSSVKTNTLNGQLAEL